MDDQKYFIELGLRIKKLREKTGLSQSDMARFLDKDRQFFQRLEKGRVNPTVKSLKAIADLLKVPVGKFFSFELKKK